MPEKIKDMENWDSNFWSMNLPVQMWKDEKNGTISTVIYRPRRPDCTELDDKVLPKEVHDFCDNTIKVLRNLIRLFEEFKQGKIDHIYYPDDGMDNSNDDEKTIL